MIESKKSLDINRALKKSLHIGDSVAKMFLDFPTLKSVSFSKTNEYNDNDYSDNFRVTHINKIPIQDDYYDEDSDELQEINKENLFNEIETSHICSVVEQLSEEYDYTDEGDYTTIKRSEYLSGNKIKKSSENKEMKAFRTYYTAAQKNEKVEDISVFYNFPSWALYYCMDLGVKFSENEAVKIFSYDLEHENILYAYYYAVCVLKDRLPQAIEKTFNEIEKKIMLKTFDNDNSYLSWSETQSQYFIKKYKEFIKN